MLKNVTSTLAIICLVLFSSLSMADPLPPLDDWAKDAIRWVFREIGDERMGEDFVRRIDQANHEINDEIHELCRAIDLHDTAVHTTWSLLGWASKDIKNAVGDFMTTYCMFGDLDLKNHNWN
jgi:hypothetical protein